MGSHQSQALEPKTCSQFLGRAVDRLPPPPGPRPSGEISQTFRALASPAAAPPPADVELALGALLALQVLLSAPGVGVGSRGRASRTQYPKRATPGEGRSAWAPLNVGTACPARGRFMASQKLANQPKQPALCLGYLDGLTPAVRHEHARHPTPSCPSQPTLDQV